MKYNLMIPYLEPGASYLLYESNQNGHNSVNFEARTWIFCMVVDLEEKDEDKVKEDNNNDDDNDDDEDNNNNIFCLFLNFLSNRLIVQYYLCPNIQLSTKEVSTEY